MLVCNGVQFLSGWQHQAAPPGQGRALLRSAQPAPSSCCGPADRCNNSLHITCCSALSSKAACSSGVSPV